MSVAVTFSGRYGDILWSLPTAREIAKIHGRVEFFTMEDFASICPLLETQSYITKAACIPGWKMMGDGCGAEPHEHPPLSGYDRIYDLTYPSFPTQPLIDWIAHTNNITFHESPIPFLEAAPAPPIDITVDFKFPQKLDIFFMPFLQKLQEKLGRTITYEVTAQHKWIEAAQAIRASTLFVGDKSSNHVIAHGFGKPLLIYETARDRHNIIFKNPYGIEQMPIPTGTCEHSQNICYGCSSLPSNIDEFVNIAASIIEVHND